MSTRSVDMNVQLEIIGTGFLVNNKRQEGDGPAMGY